MTDKKLFCLVRPLLPGEHPSIEEPLELDSVIEVAGKVMSEHWAEDDPMVFAQESAQEIADWWNDRMNEFIIIVPVEDIPPDEVPEAEEVKCIFCGDTGAEVPSGERCGHCGLVASEVRAISNTTHKAGECEPDLDECRELLAQAHQDYEGLHQKYLDEFQRAEAAERDKERLRVVTQATIDRLAEAATERDILRDRVKQLEAEKTQMIDQYRRATINVPTPPTDTADLPPVTEWHDCTADEAEAAMRAELPVCPKCGREFSVVRKHPTCECWEYAQTEKDWIRYCAENTKCRVCEKLPTVAGQRLICCGTDYLTPAEWYVNNKERQ